MLTKLVSDPFFAGSVHGRRTSGAIMRFLTSFFLLILLLAPPVFAQESDGTEERSMTGPH